MRLRFTSVAVISCLLMIILLGVMLAKFQTLSKITFGVTFSSRYAAYLKLDPRQIYRQIIDELQVKNLRLPLYWEDIEAKQGSYNFTEIDWMLSLAREKSVKAIIVLGMKQPRWPECHLPGWVKSLTVVERQKEVLKFIAEVVNRYKDNPVVWAWQVENEPLLPFGEGCDVANQTFLQKEVSLVRNLSNKKIIITDSGELGFWISTMKLSDIFGTTIYRQVYDNRFGYVTYPLPAYFYSVKSDLVKSFFAPNNQETIIVELQAEPWFKDGKFISAEEQSQLFTSEQFKDYTDFAKKTGFSQAYLWGVEWWYFMDKHGYPQYLEYAKTLF